MFKIRNKYVYVLMWGCFLAVDVFIACAIAELWIRMFIPVQNICYYHDPVLGDMRCPNQKTYGHVQKGYSNILITNSEGFHDIERGIAKEPGTLRIQYYGDSLVSGVGVPVDQTIPSQIESILNTASLPYRVEVFNMASAEDSTCAQLLTFRLLGKKYSPDVVVCHFMADFRDNIFETHQRTRSPYFILDQENRLQFVPPVPVDLTTPVERLKRSSLLVRLLANKLLASKLYNDFMNIENTISSFSMNNLSQFFSLKNGDAVTSDNKKTGKQKKASILDTKAWPLTLRLIQEFRKEAEEINAKFIIVDGIRFVPNLAGKHTNKEFEEFCSANHISYVAIYEEYANLKKRKPKSKFFLNDGHPTSMGNQILSKAITGKLEKILLSDYEKNQNK